VRERKQSISLPNVRVESMECVGLVGYAYRPDDPKFEFKLIKPTKSFGRGLNLCGDGEFQGIHAFLV
jgi:hypothetical protein